MCIESVLMFMPIEPALMLAYQEDTNLHIDAYQKNVVLMSTSVLLKIKQHKTNVSFRLKK